VYKGLSRVYAIASIMMLLLSLLGSTTVYGFETRSYGIDIATLAVSKNKTIGVVIPVHVEIIWPGSGRVDIVYHGITVSDDTKESIRYSILLATRFAGKRFRDYDYRVVFKTNYSISGLSATLDFTLAYTLLLRMVKWRGGVAATGLLAPNGVVGNISGLEAKYRAALSSGYKTVIAPYYQELIGNRGYVPASSFITAYEYFSNDTLYPKYDPLLEDMVFNHSRELLRAYYSAWSEMYNLSREIMGSKIFGSMDMSSLPPLLRGNLREGLKAINESLEFIDKEKYYTAASRAFYGFWNLFSVYLYLLYKTLGVDRYRDIVEEWFTSNNTLSTQLLSEYSGRKTYSLLEIDVLVNSYERLLDSQELYNESVTALENNSIADAVTYMAVAIARQYTVRQWLFLIECSKGIGYSYTIDSSTIRDVVYEEIELSKHLVDYMKYLYENYRLFELDRIVKEIGVVEEIVDKDPVKALAYIVRIEKDLGNILLGTPAFVQLNDFVIEGIRRSIIRLMAWYLLYYDTVMPSGFTAIEFLETSPSQSLYAVSTALLHLLVLSRLPLFEKSLSSYSSPSLKTGTGLFGEFLRLSDPETIVVTVSCLVLVAIASTLLGYTVGKKYTEYQYSIRKLMGHTRGNQLEEPV